MSAAFAPATLVSSRRALIGGLTLALPLVVVAILFAAFASTGLQRTYTLFLINLIAVVGLGVFSGNSGILSFGHVAFIGLGAYVSGILTLPLATKATALPHLPALLSTIEWSLPAALIATIIIVGIVGALIGIPIVRMGGAAGVIATLGLLLIVHGTIVGASDFTRGSNAFLGVPKKTDVWTALVLAVPIILVARWYRDSRRGAQLRASREDETAARAIGIDVVRRRLGAWIVSAVICAVAGALLAHFLGAFSPSKFYFDDTLTLLTMLIVGGMTTVSGAVAGAILVTLTVEILRRVEGGVELFGWETPEMFGLTQARPLPPHPACDVSPAGRAVRQSRDRRTLAADTERRALHRRCGPREPARAYFRWRPSPRISPACARLTMWRWRSGRARSSVSSDPMAPARPRCSTSFQACCSPAEAACTSMAPTPRAGRHIRWRRPASAGPSRTSGCSAI